MWFCAVSAHAQARDDADDYVRRQISAPAPSLPAPSSPAPSSPAPEPPAPEAPAPAFGERGEWVVTAASNLQLSWIQYDNSRAGEVRNVFSPGVDWFFARDFSVGLSLDVESRDSLGYYTTGALVETITADVSLGVRFGYNLRLGDRWSLYPRLTVGPYYEVEQQLPEGALPTPTASAPSLVPVTGNGGGVTASLFAPVLFHLAPHFFVGFGPRFSRSWPVGHTALGASGDGTRVEGEIVVGGWLGGPQLEAGAPTSPPAAESAASGPPVERFGDARQLVITGELEATLQNTSFTGLGGSSWGVSVRPAAEYFIVSHVSIGAGATIGTGGGSGRDLEGVTYTSSSTQLAFAPHVGFEIPLGRRWSLYPRVWLGFEHDENELRELGVDDKWSTDAQWVGAEVPLVFHMARHFFLGLGPYVGRDLVRNETKAGASGTYGSAYPGATGSSASTVVAHVPASRAGVGLLVGGWL